MITTRYKCVHCKQVYNPMRYGNCPFCSGEQPLDIVAKYLDVEIVNLKCPVCGNETSFASFLDNKGNPKGGAYCTKCRCWTSGSKIGQHVYSEYDAGNVGTKIECPYCHSTNTKKISSVSKAGSIALFGIFAIGKSTKQWHCNNCKSDF